MNIQVICIKDCETLGDSKFIKNNIYRCQIIYYYLDYYYYYIYDKNDNIIILESNFSKYFITLKDSRKQKLKKIYNI